MLIKKIFNHPFVSIIIFLLICAIIFIFCSLPPLNSKDDLQLLAKNNSDDPIVKMQTEVDLSTLTNVDDNALSLYYSIPDDSSSIIISEFDKLVSSLYMLLSQSSIPDDNNITLSVLPNITMSDKDYVELCQRFNLILQDNNLDNVSIILFPKYPKKLANINGYEEFNNLGVIINSSSDLTLAQELHDNFDDTKTLYIRDNIISYNTTSDNLAGMNISPTTIGNDINMVYYTLAVNMPKYNTIFSPYNSLDNTLNISTDSAPNFCAIYSRLLDESWTTTQNVAVTSSSPYSPLSSYDKLKGDVELIVSPTNRSLLSSSNILYKVNEVVLVPSVYKPFRVKFNTNDFPAGISRIKAVSQNTDTPLVQSIDVVLQRDSYDFRASRVEHSNDTQYSSPSGYIPILMYHTISDTVLPESENSSVSTANFDAQMKALVDNGYHPISFKQLHDYMTENEPLPDKPFIITMDDGYLNNYTHAYPIYKKYNIPATLFVSPYYMKEENTDRHFGWAAAREMESSGLIDIQPHGYDHTPLPYLSLKDVSYHISLGLGLIEHNLGARDVKVMSYPQFRNSIFTKKTLEKLNIDLQITNLIKPYQKNKDIVSNNLKRINVPNTMSPAELISVLDSYQ